MTSPSTKWHLERRKQILAAHPEINDIPKQDPRLLLGIAILPFLQFGFAWYSSTLSILGIFILAFVAGTQVNQAIFSYLHELTHGLVHKKIKGGWYEWAMHYAGLVSVTPGVYILYRFGHFSHHREMGNNSVEKAKKFLSERYADIELLRNRYYYELKFNDGDAPRAINPHSFANPILRMITVGITYPLMTTLSAVFIANPVLLYKFVKSKFSDQPNHYHERINATAIQIILFYLWLTPLVIIAGPKALLYLILGEAFERGFLFHPKTSLILAMHKTWGDNTSYQPTTSIYGKWLPVILMNQNSHVEHHDFPNIPCRFLPRVRKIAPEFYISLHSYKNYREIIKDYFCSKRWIYAGGFSKNKTAGATL